jgi:CYTH domain-containing protein
LKSLQDLLGEVHDGQVLAGEIASVAVGAPPEQLAETFQRSEDLVDLASRVEGRLAEQLAQVDREWLGGRADPFLKKVERFGERLSARRRAGPLEIERKFLLSDLPPHARDAVPLEIDQGWMAGQMVSERVRRTRAPGSETYSRTIKLGEGVVRSEYEEPMTPEVFQSLWPLTASRRISKRRYPVPDGDRIWEIDEFLDRELVLAEVELENEGEEVVPPEWLKPYVVRDVTGEPEYVNLNLAK